MHATDVSAAQHGVSRPSLLICAGVAIVPLAGCKLPPPDGISVICVSNGDNKISVPDEGVCPLGVPEEDCYHLDTIRPIFKCYGEDEWLTMETGDTEEVEETEGIDPAGWPTHDPSLNYILENCTNQCKYLGGDHKFICANENWIIYGYDGVNQIFSKIIATALEDPGALNCHVDFGKWKPSPAESNVVQDDNVLWPSDGAIIDLSCSTVQGCAELFDENVLGHLVQSSFTPPGDDEAEADYLVTAGLGSSLMLRISNSDNPSKGSNPVEGRIEYTALDCGEPTCPFYLANLTVTNTSNTWDLHSEELDADVEVTNLDARLRGPTLGVWRPETGEIYFDDHMLELRVDYELAAADYPAFPITTYVTNDDGLFGIRHGNAAIELVNLSVRDEDLEAVATLDYVSVDGSPPVASFTLPPIVALGQFNAGLLVSSIPEKSEDPDDDLDWKLWLIDGQQVAPDYVIPAGLHTIRLEVRDSRSAFDEREQLVMITHGEQD